MRAQKLFQGHSARDTREAGRAHPPPACLWCMQQWEPPARATGGATGLCQILPGMTWGECQILGPPSSLAWWCSKGWLQSGPHQAVWDHGWCRAVACRGPAAPGNDSGAGEGAASWVQQAPIPRLAQSGGFSRAGMVPGGPRNGEHVGPRSLHGA